MLEAAISKAPKRGTGPAAMPVMEARAVDAIPLGAHWLYEPKWDGFRCLLARDGRAVTMTSKAGEDLARYFPEVAAAALALPEKRFVLDGELVVPAGKAFSFDHLLQRIHPTASRVARLARETPARFIGFDLLWRGRRQLAGHPLKERRAALEQFAADCFADTLFRLSPASLRAADARRWLKAAGRWSDGVVAKRLDLPYQAGNRDGMQKIKHYRSADCVVGGFRYASRRQQGEQVVGSLLLGLYDDEGLLHHVGFTSSFKDQDRAALTRKVESILAEESFTGTLPGGPSRWSTRRSSEWQPVKPKLVVEVSYDHASDHRFRHGTSILRWRPDKKPRQCKMDQLVPPPRQPAGLRDIAA